MRREDTVTAITLTLTFQHNSMHVSSGWQDGPQQLRQENQRSGYSTTYREWSSSDQDLVAWDPLGKTMTKNSFRRIWAVKFLHSYLPTKSFLAKRNQSNTSECPSCHRHDDTILHMYQCSTRKEWRQGFYKRFKKHCDGHKTEPSLGRYMTELLQWIAGDRSTLSPQFTGCRTQITQSRLGWLSFLQGFHTSEITAIQSSYQMHE